MLTDNQIDALIAAGEEVLAGDTEDNWSAREFRSLLTGAERLKSRSKLTRAQIDALINAAEEILAGDQADYWTDKEWTDLQEASTELARMNIPRRNPEQSWLLFANLYPNGLLRHFYLSTLQVRMCGNDPIVLVRLTLDENGPYWGWLYSDHPTNGELAGHLSMIYDDPRGVEICFPYGTESSERRGYGKVVRVRAEVIRPAVHPEGIRDGDVVQG